jgi:hypothetical protein
VKGVGDGKKEISCEKPPGCDILVVPDPPFIDKKQDIRVYANADRKTTQACLLSHLIHARGAAPFNFVFCKGVVAADRDFQINVEILTEKMPVFEQMKINITSWVSDAGHEAEVFGSSLGSKNPF